MGFNSAFKGLKYFVLDRKGFYTGYVCNAPSNYHNTDSQFSPFRY